MSLKFKQDNPAHYAKIWIAEHGNFIFAIRNYNATPALFHASVFDPTTSGAERELGETLSLAMAEKLCDTFDKVNVK